MVGVRVGVGVSVGGGVLVSVGLWVGRGVAVGGTVAVGIAVGEGGGTDGVAVSAGLSVAAGSRVGTADAWPSGEAAWANLSSGCASFLRQAASIVRIRAIAKSKMRRRVVFFKLRTPNRVICQALILGTGQTCGRFAPPAAWSGPVTTLTGQDYEVY